MIDGIGFEDKSRTLDCGLERIMDENKKHFLFIATQKY